MRKHSVVTEYEYGNENASVEHFELFFFSSRSISYHIRSNYKVKSGLELTNVELLLFRGQKKKNVLGTYA